MVLLLSMREIPPKINLSKNSLQYLILQLRQKSYYLPIIWNNFFRQRGLHSHLRRRIYEILHYYTVPSASESELLDILNSITDEMFLPTRLWAWIGSWEEPCLALIDCYRNNDLHTIAAAMHSESSQIWCIFDKNEYYNIAHKAIFDDRLDVTLILSRTTTKKGREGFNQGDIIGDRPAHLAARLGRLNHLKFLVNCENIDLMLKNHSGRNPIHILLTKLLRKSTRSDLRLSDVSAIVQDAITAVPALIIDQDRDGWSAADFAVAISDVRLLSIILILSDSSTIFRSTVDKSCYYDKLFSHALLSNNPAVLSVILPYILKYIVVRPDHQISPDSEFIYSSTNINVSFTALTDFIIFAIMHECKRSLHFLLTHGSAVTALRYLGSQGRSPLYEAVKMGSWCSLDVIRILMRYVSADNSPSPLIQVLSHPERDKMDMFLTGIDNVFSLAAYFANIDILRLLLLPEGDKKASWMRSRRGPPSFLFGRNLYRSNPIVAAIMGRYKMRGTAVFNDPLQHGLCTLRYLLVQTPFKDLISLPELIPIKFSSSNITNEPSFRITNALNEACRHADVVIVKELLSLGSDPMFGVESLKTG